MRINLSILFSIILFSSYSQVLKYADLDTYEGKKIKAETYFASNNEGYSVGMNLYFDNCEETTDAVPFLRENMSKRALRYYEVCDLALRIYKVKLQEVDDENRVVLIVYDEKTMFKYKLDIESAIAANQVFVGIKNVAKNAKEQSANSSDSSIVEQVNRETSKNKQKLVAVVDNQDSVYQEIRPSKSVVFKNTLALEDNQDAKEMLHLSALEMKKFTRSYNRSLVYTGLGLFVGGVLGPNMPSTNTKNAFTVVGAGFILAGGIKGISARQHIGRSGAYLEAYANGVRIRF